MPALHEVLSERSAEVISRWQATLRAEIIPDKLPTVELTDEIPRFIEEMIAALRRHVCLPTDVPPPDQTRAAAGHGIQRLRLGFSLDAVVREYGALHDAIIETAVAAGLTPTLGETRCVFSALIEGIAGAVAEYGRQRDAELRREHNQHIAFLAHEIRNPLTSASIACELLQDSLPREHKATGVLRRGLAEMRDLIEGALEAARTSAGATLQPEATTLGRLIDEATLSAAAVAEVKGISVRAQLAPDADLSVDRRLMRSALSNLVRNAVIYSRPGGTVEVRGRGDAGHVRIEIEDSCGGLPEGMAETAFAPFTRHDRSKPGFGLGLAIARQAVDAHGGSIQLTNLPGSGCMFVVEIPRRPAA